MILWYQKFDFVKSKLVMIFLVSQIRFCDITKSLFWYQEIHFLYHNIDYFVISQIIFDITKSNLWYQKMNLWYHKIGCL